MSNSAPTIKRQPFNKLHWPLVEIISTVRSQAMVEIDDSQFYSNNSQTRHYAFS
jgi:hypothetical protein